MYEVLSPRGESIVQAASGAAGLSDLNGKTICEMWNGGFRGELSFPVIRALLQKRYPDIKIVPYNEFPIQHIRGSTNELQDWADEAVARALQKGCDAVISGNGF
ncbi:MAG: hypothetical protein HYX92_15515 [Chloroflexi bacterium]|nr:hypothetical protein [Chloroflexota bacterium]